MTRWLEAAQKALPPPDETDKTDKTYTRESEGGELQPKIGVLSVSSVLSGGGTHVSESVQATPPPTHNHTQQEQSQPAIKLISNREWTPDTKAKPDDPEIYADSLRIHGPMSYGMAMRVLGWGGTRAGQAEDALRFAGRITFNKLGRAVLSDNENHQDEVAR